MRTLRSALVALALGGIAALGCDAGGSPELLFKVPRGRLPRSAQRAYQQMGPADSVELRLPGEWFEPPRDLKVIERAAADLSSPLSAAEAAYSAFKRYDDAWIVASFAEADREDIQGFLGDSAVKAGSRSYYEGIQAQRVHGWARYARDSTEYRLLFVSLLTPVAVLRVETFVQEDGEWRRTNQLARDDTFQITWGAFRFGRITPQ
jgi:hypothetical protein